jgi:hypothetical protein
MALYTGIYCAGLTIDFYPHPHNSVFQGSELDAVSSRSDQLLLSYIPYLLALQTPRWEQSRTSS